MKILWFTWKDRKNPLAGGAEVVNEELARRLAADGHEIIFLVAGFPECAEQETVSGYRVIRVGSRWSVYWNAYRYYKNHLCGWADLVIDEMNTMPFFCKFYVKEKNILLVHQLCRDIWFYEMPFPLSVLGYVAEFFYVRLLNDRRTITVSESTKKDLERFGFRNIHVISEGIELEPLADLNAVQKYDQPTLLALGYLRSMKRTHLILEVFEIAKCILPNLQLIIAGDFENSYGRNVAKKAAASPFRDSIRMLGKISKEKKIELLQKSHLLVATPVKEGWGLTVTEAASQGTPAVVYDVDGLRDSVRDGETGLICKRNTPQEMAENIAALLKNKEKYDFMRRTALKWAEGITFREGYKNFISNVGAL